MSQPQMVNLPTGNRALFDACTNLAQRLCEAFPMLARDIMAGSTISVVTNSRKTIRIPIQIQKVDGGGAQLIIPHHTDIPRVINEQQLNDIARKIKENGNN